MTRRAVPATIPAKVTLACPVCKQRYTTTLPLVAAACHDRHKFTLMVVVEDCDSTDTGDAS